MVVGNGLLCLEAAGVTVGSGIRFCFLFYILDTLTRYKFCHMFISVTH